MPIHPCSNHPTCLPTAQSDFLEAVKAELIGAAFAAFAEKSNDLYDFAQTRDLGDTRLPATAKLRDALYGAPFRQFLHAGMHGQKLPL